MKKHLAKLTDSLVDDVFRSVDLREATARDYRYRVDVFMRHVDENGLDHNAFIEFKRSLADRMDISTATKNKFLTSARILLKELNRRGVMPVDITQNVKSFDQVRGHKRVGLDDADIEAVQKTLSFLPPTRSSLRLYSIFSLLVCNGLRLEEVVRINREDVDLDRGTAFIRGKGRNEKELIFLAPDVTAVLYQYINATGVDSGALFRSFSDRTKARLTTRTLHRELTALLARSGVSNEKTPHGIRHYYITNLLKHMGVHDVRKFSRHKSLDMLLVYEDELHLKEKAEKVFSYLPKLAVSMSDSPNYKTYSSVGRPSGEFVGNGTREARTCELPERLAVAVAA